MVKSGPGGLSPTECNSAIQQIENLRYGFRESNAHRVQPSAYAGRRFVSRIRICHRHTGPAPGRGTYRGRSGRGRGGLDQKASGAVASERAASVNWSARGASAPAPGPDSGPKWRALEQPRPGRASLSSINPAAAPGRAAEPGPEPKSKGGPRQPGPGLRPRASYPIDTHPAGILEKNRTGRKTKRPHDPSPVLPALRALVLSCVGS